MNLTSSENILIVLGDVMAKESMFELARMILNDQCPPDNKMYLCRFGEEAECRCVECWDRYLFWAVNGYRGDPYEFDRKKII